MTSTAKTSIAPDVSYLVDGQTADAADVLAAIEDLRDYVRSGAVSVSANDTHVKHLQDAISVGTGLSEAVTSGSGNEGLALSLDSKLVNLLALLPASGMIQAAAVDSESSTSGYVLTANGSGGTTFAAAAGGGAAPVDITGTAGEALDERDAVYLAADDTWYKIDSDATGGVGMGRLRGIVNESGGISSAGTGSIRMLGEVSGFSGLTPWAAVYASTTAGGLTQTKPTVTAGGAQIALAQLGFATSATAVMVWPGRVEYIKRASLANAASLTVEHHSDAQAHERNALARVLTIEAGAELTGYAASNQDSSTVLRETSAAGGTTTISAAGLDQPIGNSSGVNYWASQTFQVTAGRLSQFTFTLRANSGSPSGTMTWQICEDDTTAPGTILATGTLTPTASAVNSVDLTDGPRLAASTTYWLILKPTVAQSSNVRWNWALQSATYASGQRGYTANDGVSWTLDTYDLACAFTTSALVEKDKLAQSFELSAGATVDTAKLWLRKIGSPSGTMTLRVETDSSGAPSGTLADASATVTVNEATLSTSYGWITFDFATDFALSSSTSYWLVLSTDRAASADNYVLWGMDGSTPAYASGEAQYEASSTWSAESMDACFAVFAPPTSYAEPVTCGRWSGGQRDMAVRFDNGAAADGNTKTTFKNTSGSTLDVTCVVELA